MNSIFKGRNKIGLARESYPFLLVFSLLGLVCTWFYSPLIIPFAGLILFTLYFFRDPHRFPAPNSEALFSPADGKVLKIEKVEKGPYLPEPHQKISIFMSPFNVHVNRIPMDGKVEKVVYSPGKFFVASLDKASLDNERNAVIMETVKKEKVAFIQIAGLVARRIICYLQQGMEVTAGQRYGLIRFGSRMEVCLPIHWKVLVKPGDRVKAGESPLANRSRN
jgi:phosphatidylserine decarboxylase